MTYEETIRRLSEGTQRIVRQLVAAHEGGTLTASELDTLVLQVVQIATARGRDLGELKVRAYLELVTGEPVSMPPTPTPVGETARLTRALRTIRASGLDSAMQLDRLAGNEPVSAANDSAMQAMTRSRRVKGWTRGLEGDACELCQWWWREGRVFRPEHPMPRHIGCMCDPVPVITETDNAQTARQAKLARARTGQRSRQAARDDRRRKVDA